MRKVFCMLKRTLITLLLYTISNFSMHNGDTILQNKEIISIVCNGPHKIFDLYNFPMSHLKLGSTTNIRSSYGWPKRGKNFDKGVYFLSKKHSIEIGDNPSPVAQKINEILPSTLFEEEYAPSYKTNTPNDMFDIAVDLKDRQSIGTNAIHQLYTILGFKTELQSRSTGLSVAYSCKEFSNLKRIKKLNTPINVYRNIMKLPQKILIRLKEYITNAYYKYTGFDELVTGKFTHEEELNKWITDEDSDKELITWIKKHNLNNKLFFKKEFSNDPNHPELYTIVNTKIESIWKSIEPIISQEKNVAIINKLYVYLELLTIWEVFRNIHKIQRDHCKKTI